MIAKAAPSRRSGRGSFVDLRTYLEKDDLGNPRPDLVMTWSGNVGSHATADLEMDRIGMMGSVHEPVYHVILSWRPGEEVAPEAARAGVDAVLRSIGAEDHQWYAALHVDEGDGRTHLHLAINKVDHVTLRSLNLWRDRPKLARAAEFVEREYGCLPDHRMAWREYLPEIDLGFSMGAAEQHMTKALGARIRAEPPGAQTREMDAVRRAGYSWATLLEREAIPAALAVSAREGTTWGDLHATLETYHVHLERAGSGLRVVGPQIGQHLKASRIGLKFRELEAKLGAYQESPLAADDLADRLDASKQIVKNAQSWETLHEGLATLSLALERRGAGGRVRDLSGSGLTASLGRVGSSMPKLEKRLGTYELPPELRAAEQNEQERRRAGVTQRLEALAADPAALLSRITVHHAVWTGEDVGREVARVVGVEIDELHAEHKAGYSASIAAALAGCDVISVEERRSFAPDGSEIVTELKRYSTAEVIEQERRAFAAIDALVERERAITLRPASQALDAQQRAAYEHLADGISDLRVATGIAGAGKSRLLRDVCSAYSEAGYKVIGTAVAGSAARVLGEEAHIPTRTIARFLIDLERGRATLDDRSVIVVDEASMLGTDDAKRLFEAARDGGSRVLLLGDTRQHEAVARGPVLGEIVERYASRDLHATRRAQDQWLREVGTDLRAGRTSRALDVLRERSCIAQHASTEEAMVALVGRYIADRESAAAGGAEWEGLLIATRRADVTRLNELMREALREELGPERTYETAFGRRALAVGDRVVTREPHRQSATVNGDTWVVAGHRPDRRIELVRDRDGVRVAWDLREPPALDHGYATTSYRSQGRTVDCAYVLASSSEGRRGMYVDVTRARQNVMIAYGQDEVSDFGALLGVVARDRAKLTIAAVERGRELEFGDSPELADVLERSETYSQSMRTPMYTLAIGQRVEGKLVWKQEVPGMDAFVVLVSEGKAFHRCIVKIDDKSLKTGERVRLEIGAKATIVRQPGMSRGMRL